MSERYGGYDTEDGAGEPTGEAADWYRQGVQLLEAGDPAAAAQLLTKVAQKTPDSAPVLEALARAHFDGGLYEQAVESFAQLAHVSPDDDYAQFGWGLAAARLGDFETSAEHLALAVAMRPTAKHYRAALRHTRATLKARAGGFGTVGGDRGDRHHDMHPGSHSPHSPHSPRPGASHDAHHDDAHYDDAHHDEQGDPPDVR
jgi:tetratricopeptide (TPR) repeat protein